MHPAQIKAALTIAGFRQTEAATALGVAPTTIGAVINGRSRSKQVEEWIAKVTGEPLEKLWPQWYGQPEPQLTADERLILEAFRKMPPQRRAQMVADITSEFEVLRAAVKADRGSIAAGGDVHIGKTTQGSGRRRSK